MEKIEVITIVTSFLGDAFRQPEAEPAEQIRERIQWNSGLNSPETTVRFARDNYIYRE